MAGTTESRPLGWLVSRCRGVQHLHADRGECQVLRRAVAWHLSHPPGDPDGGFTADDAALAAAR